MQQVQRAGAGASKLHTPERFSGRPPFEASNGARRLRFNKYHVTDGVLRARVRYSLALVESAPVEFVRTSRLAVALQARDPNGSLPALMAGPGEKPIHYSLFPVAFIYEGEPFYAAARARCDINRATRSAKSVH